MLMEEIEQKLSGPEGFSGWPEFQRARMTLGLGMARSNAYGELAKRHPEHYKELREAFEARAERRGDCTIWRTYRGRQIGYVDMQTQSDWCAFLEGALSAEAVQANPEYDDLVNYAFRMYVRSLDIATTPDLVAPKGRRREVARRYKRFIEGLQSATEVLAEEAAI